MNAPDIFGRAATQGYSPLTGLPANADRVPLGEVIAGKYTRGQILWDAMNMRGLDASNLLHRAKVLANDIEGFTIPARFRAAEIERWFTSGKNATAPRDLFECACNVVQATPLKEFEAAPAKPYRFH